MAWWRRSPTVPPLIRQAVVTIRTAIPGEILRYQRVRSRCLGGCGGHLWLLSSETNVVWVCELCSAVFIRTWPPSSWLGTNDPRWRPTTWVLGGR